MIFDQLANAHIYGGLGGWWPVAAAYLQSPDAQTQPEGRHALDGDRLFALIQHYEPRPIAACRWEAHRRYIDVQCVARGVERIGVAPVGSMRSAEGYDDARDVAFFEGAGDFVTLRPGAFAVLFPWDAHQPCVRSDEIGPVRKIVIKAHVDLLKAARG